ncbi:MAG: C10 family peptidase [Bacteroidales bacterium]|nr:C10 family peptidase [Bacteroidales bacterium]MCF8343530.1 C10 family peptidase [Bacteroidales bacterium]MCF8349821.1 C10 family peptidase [Bacteroidales bacterium]MCF8375941.1 C10 family peptidase [Bacteroidales bacterium]
MKKTILTVLGFLFAFYLSAQVQPMIQNNWQTFQWPYNAYYPEDDNGVNGHVGNACGHTAMARILHYWEYPANGIGVLDFTDYFGNDWYVDLENLNLDYNDMPYELDWNDPESVYEQTAKLFLATGAIGALKEIGFTNGILRIPYAMQQYMSYSTEMEVVNRWDYTKEEWIAIFKNELDNGRPIFIDGRTEDSPPPWEPGSWEGHFFVCDGYNENDAFYMNYMFGGISGYYDIDDMGDYKAYHRIILNFEPQNVGMEEYDFSNELSVSIYPNPLTDQELSVEVENSKIRKTNVELLDLSGKTIKKIADRAFHGNQIFKVNTGDLKSGSYLLKIQTTDEVRLEKVIVL